MDLLKERREINRHQYRRMKSSSKSKFLPLQNWEILRLLQRKINPRVDWTILPLYHLKSHFHHTSTTQCQDLTLIM
ncbi:hypothetical protein FGO68_gene1043 [Halteria grandinella]|uniref:Uncharacterized protein n=1 Tax=Halteria grandinella TaxID=5974 RepID=A0A8J8NA17_HALGN|nr:hypothetical protein FGO68_gene1043 [Halteria grandinella]